MRSHPPARAVFVVLLLLAAGCQKSKTKATDLDSQMGPAAAVEVADTTPAEEIKPRGKPVVMEIPLGLPPLPGIVDMPLSDELVKLGRKLFYDGNFAADSITACSSCHGYEHGFADDKQVAIGFGGNRGERNTPSLLNVAYMTQLNWDGSVTQPPKPVGLLEEQVHFAFEDPAQLDVKIADVEKKLYINDQAHLGMQKAFGRMVTIKYLLAARAIAAFERTLLSGNSPFDKYYFGKDENAISSSAKNGWAIFKDPKKGNCIACHTVEDKFALFTDQKFHNLGVGVDSTGEGRDLGRFKVTQKTADRGAFRTPSLRNVALTPPYMHNGSLRSLRLVVDYYCDGGNPNPYLDPSIKRFNLTDKERDDLVSFLQTLTGDKPFAAGRPSVRDDLAAAAEDEKPPQ